LTTFIDHRRRNSVDLRFVICRLRLVLAVEHIPTARTHRSPLLTNLKSARFHPRARRGRNKQSITDRSPKRCSTTPPRN